ncbi:hypothetical protein PG996_007737 [Apiospora saccharicola]|uniref:Uncharacterized protein n=1 Tax=Apiospora saccharicola TaxID=335842 RepID=A0ABR1VBQ4_9PEZI
MHYIRLLRPVSVETPTNNRRGGDVLSVLLTITTDLGDSFFSPDKPLALGLTLGSSTGGRVVLACPADDKSPLQWRAGLRVLKAQLRLREPLPKDRTTVGIFARSSHQSKTPSTRPHWRHGYDDGQSELIVPVSVDMVNRKCAPVSLRKVPLPTSGDASSSDGNCDLELGEDIGESIARHIWDAGLVTASFLSDSCRDADAMVEILPALSDTLNILELGCGVGILGTTIAGIVEEVVASQGKKSLVEAHVLLTDVDEAEERACANIARAEEVFERRDRLSSGGEEEDEHESEKERPRVVQLQYENLDWDDGRQGKFGPLAAARPWDFVVLSDCTYNVDSLPALIGTLSALHSHSSVARASQEEDIQGGGAKEMRVILATKPRHASEEALFGLLREQGWSHRVVKRIPLPRVNAEDEVVEIYMLEKGKK